MPGRVAVLRGRVISGCPTAPPSWVVLYSRRCQSSPGKMWGCPANRQRMIKYTRTYTIFIFLYISFYTYVILFFSFYAYKKRPQLFYKRKKKLHVFISFFFTRVIFSYTLVDVNIFHSSVHHFACGGLVSFRQHATVYLKIWKSHSFEDCNKLAIWNSRFVCLSTSFTILHVDCFLFSLSFTLSGHMPLPWA